MFAWRVLEPDGGGELVLESSGLAGGSGAFSSRTMSDESAPAPDSPEVISQTPAEPAPKVRRISSPRLKKSPKEKAAENAGAAVPPAPEEKSPVAEVVEAEAPFVDPVTDPAPEPVAETEVADIPQTGTADTPESSEDEDEDGDSSAEGDWPEPEPAQTGGAPQESGKRKRRRRKGKGQQGGGQNSSQPAAGEGEGGAPASSAEPRPQGNGESRQGEPRPQQPAQQGQGGGHPQRPRLDPEDVAKLALKIYLAEVSEEGVALIGDNDAKDLARRCFRLAEIFMEEQGRRR